MGSDDDDSPRRTVVAFARAWDRLDFTALAALLAPDVDYRNVPLAPIVGRARVDRYLRSAGPFDACEWRLLSIACDGTRVLTERIDVMVVGGTTIELPVMGVFEVEGGLIRRWHDYFDHAAYRAQWPAREPATVAAPEPAA